MADQSPRHIPKIFYPVPDILSILHASKFEEKALGMSSAAGSIDELIRQGHQYMRSNIHATALQILPVSLPGIFDNGRDELNYQFKFEYNRETDKMRIVGVRTSMNDEETSRQFLYHDSRRLDSSLDMYRILKEARHEKALEVFVTVTNRPHLVKSKHL